MRRWILLPALLMLASCSLNVPPDSASADDVLAAYLRALRSGDCSTTHALATGTFGPDNGDLCGRVRVNAARVDGRPVELHAGELTYMTTINVTGADESMYQGDNTWFYSLAQQPSGAWRLVSGGSGP